MRVTIKDVAKRAGVSTSTVSRVLNKNSVISPETTEQIHKAMRDLNYIPNDLARSFAKASSHVIGLVVEVRKIIPIVFFATRYLLWNHHFTSMGTT